MHATRTLKRNCKKIPFAPSAYRYLQSRYARYQLNSKASEFAENTFTEIYRNNIWGAKDLVSGSGSDLHQTKAIMQEIPELLAEYNASTMLDIPCGDFH